MRCVKSGDEVKLEESGVAEVKGESCSLIARKARDRMRICCWTLQHYFKMALIDNSESRES